VRYRSFYRVVLSVLIGTLFLLESCASIDVAQPRMKQSQGPLVLTDGNGRVMDRPFGYVPRSARFVLLETGETNLYYVDIDDARHA